MPSLERGDCRGGLDFFGAAERLAMCFAGSASNVSRQPSQQNQYVCPSCSERSVAVLGSIVIPQTGSIVAPAMGVSGRSSIFERSNMGPPPSKDKTGAIQIFFGSVPAGCE